MNPTGRDSFLAVVAGDVAHKETQASETLRAAARSAAGGRCWFCGQPSDRVERMFGSRAGGRISLENLIVVCRSCSTARQGCDPLEFAECRKRPLSAKQLADREASLTTCAGHGLVPSRHRTNGAVHGFLREKRWCHPRKVLLVGHGFEPGQVLLAAAEPRPSAYTFALLLYAAGCGGEWVESPTFARVPADRWPEAARWLVEHHAHLRPLYASPATDAPPSIATEERVYDGLAGVTARR